MRKLLDKLMFSSFTRDKSWATKFMQVEYAKEYNMMRKNGINVTGEIAYDFLSSNGGLDGAKHK